MPKLNAVWRDTSIKLMKRKPACKVCGNNIKTTGNTNYFRQHLLNVHNLTLDGRNNFEPEEDSC